MANFRKFIGVILVFLTLQGSSQEVRFSVQLGAAIPLGSFSQNDIHPKNGGFAQTGFNFDLVAARSFKSNLVVGVSLGYAVFGLDENAIQDIMYSKKPNEIKIESQSYQNIDLQARLGYDIILFEEKLIITPFLDAGLGVFNSASYVIIDEAGNTAVRKGNTSVGFLVSPGMNFRVPLNNFVDLKIYGNYQSLDYKVDEEFVLTGGINDTFSETITYRFTTVNAGMGFTIRF